MGELSAGDACTTHFTTQQGAAPNRTISPQSPEGHVAKGLVRSEAMSRERVRETN